MLNGYTAVQLQMHTPNPADDPFIAFYNVVRHASGALGFRHYSNFISALFCRSEREDIVNECLNNALVSARSELPQNDFCFSGTKAYDQITEATSLFIACQSALLDDCCGTRRRRERDDLEDLELAPALSVASQPLINGPLLHDSTDWDVMEVNRRFAPGSITLAQLQAAESRLFAPPTGTGVVGAGVAADPRLAGVLTFMQQLVENQPGVPLKDCTLGSGNCIGMLVCKLRCPPLLELIWSYWMEQGMLVQGLNALSLRFQNRRYPGPDTLRRCDISPLRPLSNVFWGYVQREQNRLSLARRAYEYDHHYGLRLKGPAVPEMLPADSRSQFIEAFHRLLLEASRYYRTAMDTTMNADAFPALNCLRELHLVLAEGAHNQFGDLPTTARGEMLLQQWLLARPEVREFLGGRPGVPYPEAWMPHLDTLRQFMGWNDASIRHYRDLATYGEQLLLSIRYLPWSTVNDSTIAAGWLSAWRPEVQAYVHAYRAVTGVDLSMAEQPVIASGGWTAQPSDLIGRRLGQPAAQQSTPLPAQRIPARQS
ncbi:hypothetical protein [Paraburkholderia caribensis]|uniref:hypothetical protein n=1 Tax=Paraburkholderia caribensis TaxID=75105 RepID=UPI0034D372C4